MKLKKMFTIIAMLMVVFMVGCKKDDIPEVRPTVTSTDPVNEAISTSISSNISATFSTPMDPSSITISSFTVQQGTDNILGEAGYTDSTATFTPAEKLAPNTLYTATITTEAKDVAGIALLEDYIWSFTTGGIPDIASPTVTLADPLNNATGVAVNKAVAVTFSEALDPLTMDAATFTLKQGSVSVSGAVSYTGVKATFTPSGNLEYSKVYTGTVTTGAKDLAGNALAGNYTFSFTTIQAPDIILPVINLTDPLNNATGVAISKLMAVTFSETMDPASITSLTYTLMQGSTSVTGAVSYTGLKATFTPAGNLEYSKVYTGTVTTGAKDLAGNALAGNYTFSFTTVQAPDIIVPVINLTDPLNNATGVAANKVVALTFSEAMDPLTINATTFTLKQGTTAVSGAVAYTGTTATFTPANALAAGTVYTATITTGAKDLAGNALAANTVLSFTTISATSNLAVVDLGAAGNYVILAKTAINNSPISAITGDMGLSPAATSFITGFSLTNFTGYATSPQVTGNLYAADMASPTGTNLTTAVENMITAYNDAAGRPSPAFSELGTGNIGGKTLTPGLYKWTNTVSLPTSITISGSANDVWIFQIAGDLTVSSAVNVTLVGGAQAKNIFWQVAGQVTIGTTSHFEGILLSKTGITLLTGASLKGRALAQTAVILDGSTVVNP